MEGNGDGGDGVLVCGEGWVVVVEVFLKLARQGVVSDLYVILADLAL